MGRRERKGRGRKVELIWEKCREAAGRARADASAICSGQGRVTKPGDTGIVTAGGELGTALPAYFSRQKLLSYFVVVDIENSPGRAQTHRSSGMRCLNLSGFMKTKESKQLRALKSRLGVKSWCSVLA